ncbi:MAG: metallopeptidase TldD-related protein [Bacteriovoracia bacterium]
MITREYFQKICETLFSERPAREHLTMELTAEASQFCRINAAKIRQLGTVADALYAVQLTQEGTSAGQHRQGTASFTLTGEIESDLVQARAVTARLRSEVAQLPPDPFCEVPKNHGHSNSTRTGHLLRPDEAAEALVKPAQGVDLAGIYAAGAVIRANANSTGQFHWFSTDNFVFDYSIYTANQKALKGSFAGQHWDSDTYALEMRNAAERSHALAQAPKKLSPGAYRTYLAPACFSELLPMFSWGCIGEASLRQGDSPLLQVRQGRQQFSPKFTLSEDFRGGEVPRFNDKGEVAPEYLALIAEGELKNTLVSSRTALEYGLTGNGAGTSEGLRAPAVAGGSLPEGDAVRALGTGLYLSNLHYLNWSDRLHGRITGMTRYACFWVENGKLQSPIENLRFDDSIFSLFGTALEDLTRECTPLTSTDTYGFRSLGVANAPGVLLKQMTFTL